MTADSVAPPRTHWSHAGLWMLAGVAAAGIAALALWCVYLPTMAREAFPIGDGALTEIYTIHASRGQLTLGPYSRFGWHHPGPLFFYIVVPFYALAREHTLAMNAAALAINLGALATLGWCLARAASPALCLTVAAALAAYLWRLPLVLVSAWNPHVVLLPLTALIVAASTVAAGRLSLLPIVVLAASLIAQTHIGLVPCAAIAGGCALIAGLVHVWRGARGDAARGRAGGRAAWRWIAASAALAGALWFLPLLEQVTAADGNASQIARFFWASERTLTPTEALSVWAAMITGVMRTDLEFPVGTRGVYPATAWTIAGAIATVALLAIAGEWTARRARAARARGVTRQGTHEAAGTPTPGGGHRSADRIDPAAVDPADVDRVETVRADGGERLLMEAWCCRLSALLAVAAYAAVSGIRGGLADYLVAWVTIVGTVGIASLAAVAIHAWVARWVWVLPVVTIGGLTIAAASGFVQLERLRAELPLDTPYERMPAESLYGAARALIARTQARRTLIHVSDGWDTGAAVLLPLYRRGIPVAIGDEALWMFGAPLARDGTEDLDLTVAHRDARATQRQQIDDCMVIERHGRSLHVRLSSLPKPVPLVCE